MKNNKGITLIALVITVIILLILAMVTIAFLIGDDGIIARARKATDDTERAMHEEAQALEKLDKYIVDSVENPVEKPDFENNGIDKSHDGARYDEVETDDGMWTVYKDIDTETRKVNVYVASKYYRPSFEEFVLEKYYLNTILYSYALPVYSFSDLSDAVSSLVVNRGNNFQLFMELLTQEKVKQRMSEMGVGPTLSEVFELMGVEEYDVLTEIGKKLVRQLQANEELSVSGGESAELNGTDFGKILGDISDYEDSGCFHGSELNYNNLLNSYNKLYGNKANLTIPEEIKNNIYKIELPDGTSKEFRGDELYKARVRYITTKNGNVQVKIATNSTDTKTINYTGVTNIGSCMYEEGEYLYTYNCLPMIDDLSGFFMEMSIYKDILENGYNDEIEVSYKYNKNDSMIYRFNLGGWNAISSEFMNKIENNLEDLYNSEITLTTKVKDSINGQPVTILVNTFQNTKMEESAVYIPSSVKYLFNTFRDVTFNENVSSFDIPNTVKHASYVFQETIATNENLVIRVPESLGNSSPTFGYCPHANRRNFRFELY